MNLDINQHETAITAPDDSSKMVHEAIQPPGKPHVVIPDRTDSQPGTAPGGKSPDPRRGKLYGLRLAYRGLYLLGAAFGSAAVWFAAAWVRYGRMPLLRPRERMMSIGSPPSAILPPTWLVAVVGLLVLVSICMMLLGTHDTLPKMKRKKDE